MRSYLFIFIFCRIFYVSLLLLLTLGLNACTAITYYTQSVVGHTRLMMAREPVDEVIKTADDALKKQLRLAEEIRRFAIQSLSLPDNGSYTSYVKLKGDVPVWNVVAAEALSLKPKQWCYLVIGCASYRGYYDKRDASDYAEKLRREQFDVNVIGASAYSTLGWFADPLTSAMLKRNTALLAELVFHELAHQQLYVNGDSRFNEAFASAVGEQGTLRWLKETGRHELLKDYQTRLSIRGDFNKLVHAGKARLQALYSSDKSRAEKIAGKAEVFEWMRDQHKQLIKEKWQGRAWYRHWFQQKLNNAHMVALATYRDLLPDFIDLFQQCDQNFPRFYQKVEAIAETPTRDLRVGCGVGDT